MHSARPFFWNFRMEFRVTKKTQKQPSDAKNERTISRFCDSKEKKDPVRSVYLQTVSIFHERELLSDLSSPAQIIYLVQTFDLEMANGGIHQFFCNSSGNFALETTQALRTLNAFGSCDILQRGIGFLALDELSLKNRVARYETIEQKQLEANFAKLDDEFEASVFVLPEQPREPENLWFKCLDWIEMNSEAYVHS